MYSRQKNHEVREECSLNLFDTMYVKLCDFSLNYSGLVSSVTAGVAIGDSNNVVFNESARLPVCIGGLVGGTSTPWIDQIYLDIKAKNHNSSQELMILDSIKEYRSYQYKRNFVSFMAASLIISKYQRPSLTNVLVSVFFGGASLLYCLKTRKARKKLESLVINSETK